VKYLIGAWFSPAFSLGFNHTRTNQKAPVLAPKTQKPSSFSRVLIGQKIRGGNYYFPRGCLVGMSFSKPSRGLQTQAGKQLLICFSNSNITSKYPKCDYYVAFT
jgi:hypothetical protein